MMLGARKIATAFFITLFTSSTRAARATNRYIDVDSVLIVLCKNPRMSDCATDQIVINTHLRAFVLSASQNHVYTWRTPTPLYCDTNSIGS